MVIRTENLCFLYTFKYLGVKLAQKKSKTGVKMHQKNTKLGVKSYIKNTESREKH